MFQFPSMKSVAKMGNKRKIGSRMHVIIAFENVQLSSFEKSMLLTLINVAKKPMTKLSIISLKNDPK